MNNNQYFGEFLTTLPNKVELNSSELGTAVMLFGLAVSTNAVDILEIGRWKGLSTFAFSSALRYLDIPRTVPECHKQRKDIDYSFTMFPPKRKLVSVDPYPQPEAYETIKTNELNNYVEFIDKRSDTYDTDKSFDIIFIDGDHTYNGCSADVRQYILSTPKYLKDGGYFIIHDYFGWFEGDGENKSPIKKVCDELVALNVFEHILIDIKFMSFVIFRKKNK